MGDYVKAGKTADFQDGSKQKVSVSGQEVLLARIGDSYYAVGNRCPHLGGDLAAGTLEGTIITCPRHQSQFDVRDGSVVRWLKGSGVISALGKALKPARPLRKYNVRLEADTILVEV